MATSQLKELTHAHKCINEALRGLREASLLGDDATKDIITSISDRLFDLQKELVIVESYARFEECGWTGPKYDYIYEAMYRMHKEVRKQ